MFLLLLLWGLRSILDPETAAIRRQPPLLGSQTAKTDAKTDYKESTSTPDESDPQYKESGIEEEFPKNPELKRDSDHDLRYGQQQISHRIITAPYLLVKRQPIKAAGSRFATLPDELQVELSLKVAVLHEKTALPSDANLEICFRKLLKGFIQQKTEAKRKQTDDEDMHEILRRTDELAQYSSRESEDKYKSEIQVLNEELLLHRNSSHHLDLTLKTTLVDLDNEKQKNRALEVLIGQLQNESAGFLKQRDDLRGPLEREIKILNEQVELQKANQRHLDETRKTAVRELDNEKRKCRDLEKYLKHFLKENVDLLKQRGELREQLEAEINIKDEELLSYRANNHHLDDTLKTTIIQLDNAIQNNRGLETQPNQFRNKSVDLPKQTSDQQQELAEALMFLHENADYQPPSKTELSELPWELLDAILMNSILHWMLQSSTHQRDEYIIRALTSVDFCWLQRIRRRRFKKRIWKKLKHFYGKSRKNSAIIRNNQNYLLANIQSDSTLIVSLLSSDCITEAQSHLIQRQRSNRHKNTELLWAMKSVDVEKFSNFVKCLRQTNQKTVARIMENGGVVAKVDVQNHGANCTTSKETKELFHQTIEGYRNRIKPCSLQSNKLISQLNGEGIEILNSQLDRQTVVVWIWCRSQTALEHIQRLYESNQLRDLLYCAAGIRAATPEHQNVVSIEENEFKKTVVVCLISINFTQEIDFGKYDSVLGITKLRNEICIMVRQRSSNSAIELSVFENKIPFCLTKKMKMNQFHYLDELGSCEKENCLYVRDSAGRCVWKIAIEKEETTIKWLTFDYRPERMSVTSDGELLIVNQSSSELMIYGSDAELLRSIQLPIYIKHLMYVVKTSIGNFIIINEDDEEEKDEEEEEEEEEDEEKEEEDDAEEEKERETSRGYVMIINEKEGETGPRQRKHEKKRNFFVHVRELTSDGQTVIRRFVPLNKTQQLNDPQSLLIDSDDQVIVADMGNGRVILLDSDLKWKSVFCPTKDERKIRLPIFLCHDEEKKQLIVSGFAAAGGLGVNVYNSSRD